jgi:hypothetical protein
MILGGGLLVLLLGLGGVVVAPLGEGAGVRNDRHCAGVRLDLLR